MKLRNKVNFLSYYGAKRCAAAAKHCQNVPCDFSYVCSNLVLCSVTARKNGGVSPISSSCVDEVKRLKKTIISSILNMSL